MKQHSLCGWAAAALVLGASATIAQENRISIWQEPFDGFGLSQDWSVERANPDEFVVEEGELLILSSTDNRFQNAEGRNVFIRNEELPSGDLDIVLKGRVEFQTGADALQFGLFKSPESNLFATLSTSTWSNCGQVTFSLTKTSGGESTVFDTQVLRACASEFPMYRDDLLGALSNEGFELTIQRRGRSYSGHLTIPEMTNEDGSATVWTTNKLTSLRSPGTPGLTLSKYDNDRNGELLAFIESMELFTVE